MEVLERCMLKCKGLPAVLLHLQTEKEQFPIIPKICLGCFVLIAAGSLAAKPQLIYEIYPKLFGIINAGCNVYKCTTLSDDFRSRNASASETDTNVQSW